MTILGLSFCPSLSFKWENILLFVAGVLPLLIHDQGFENTIHRIIEVHFYDDCISFFNMIVMAYHLTAGWNCHHWIVESILSYFFINAEKIYLSPFCYNGAVSVLNKGDNTGCYMENYDTSFMQTVRRRTNENAMLLKFSVYLFQPKCLQKIKTTEVKIYTQFIGNSSVLIPSFFSKNLL